MRRSMILAVAGLLLLVGAATASLPVVQGSPLDGEINLTPLWTTGITSDGAGPAHIIVTDLTGDNVADIVTCNAEGSLFVLNKVPGPAVYDTKFFSPLIGCTRVAVADRDNDGTQEIYVAGLFSGVHIYRGDTFAEIGSISLPGSNVYLRDIAVGDVDSDNQKEIVLATDNDTFVYDANTLALEWDASGKGGSAVALGQIDGDPGVEIVVNGAPAHVLDAGNKAEKWSYPGGFGYSMAVYDVDGDGMAEISYVKDADLTVFDADTMTTHWHVHSNSIGWLTVNAGLLNGVRTVVAGNEQWGSVIGYMGTDGTQLWSVANPDHGVFGIGIGDADNDLNTEVLWGAGLSSSGRDALYVGDPVSQSVEWSTPDLDGPLHIAAADLDNDGQTEIVMASTQTDSNYLTGEIRAYDGKTHQLKWKIAPSNFLRDYQLAIGQVDSDAAKEIVVAGTEWSEPKVRVYDGITHELEWQSPSSGGGGGAPGPLIVKNIDSDPVDEIIVSSSVENINKVLVYDGDSGVVQWDSGDLDGLVLDLALGDLDGNGVPELAVVTSRGLYVYEVGTWTQRTHKSIDSLAHAAIVEGHGGNPGQLLLVDLAPYPGSTLLSWDGGDFHLSWQRSLANQWVSRLVVADFAGDGGQEFAVLGNIRDMPQGVFSIGQVGSTSGWLYQSQGEWGPVDSLFLADLDGDGHKELGFATESLIQVDSINLQAGPSGTATPSSTTTSLPTSTATATATSTATAVPCTINFSDVHQADYFYEPVRYLFCHGAISGYGDGTFRPYNNTTRGQLSKIVVLAEGWQLLNPQTATFSDVAPGTTFYQYIETAYAHNIISGYSDHTFRPGNDVTRGQLSKIIVLAQGWQLSNPAKPTFNDVPAGSPFYQYVESAYSHGIISGYGDGSFRPGNDATRGQIAKMVYKAITGK